ncbi:MAG: NAD(P)-dependent alcohol dehydrogenase [Phocaeicola dorei]|nr:NAD(P)-dependent alcohol dehydrogenase [Phocaeicola dorei]
MRKFLIIFSCAVIGTVAVQAQSDNRIPAKGFAVSTSHGNFQPYEFSRHTVGDNDVLIEILYAGICHSDIHTAHGDWGEVNYPLVPGHEIAGRVVFVGKNVTKFKKDDYAGVGCLVNSCLKCDECKAGYEQDCAARVLTYAATDRYHGNKMTQGGYSDKIVVSEDFAIKIPAEADLKRVAPLLCAGITTYSPIHFSQVKQGDKVAVAGFGGLGHLAVKYLVKLGAEVTVFDVTDDKRQAALDMGAVRYISVKHPEELNGTDSQFKFLLSTVPVGYDMSTYLRMVKRGGDMAIVGMPAHDQMPSIDVNSLIHLQHRNVYGSMIGGIRQTQEMLDYSVENDIYPDVKIIEADGAAIDNAYRNVQDGKVQFRYVIDMSTMK